MSSQRGVTIFSPGDARMTDDVPKPALRDDYILVKTVCVAVNPTDWKMIDWLPSKGAIVGCDYSGIVEDVGKAVKKPWNKGDRVCGFVHGSNKLRRDGGAFAEHIIAKGDMQIRIPEQMSFEEAATLGVAVSTVGQNQYQNFRSSVAIESYYGFAFVTDQRRKLCMWDHGYSNGKAVRTSHGSLGRVCRLTSIRSGLTVLTTCSPHNTDLVRSLGADAVFNYRDEDCGRQIREYTKDKLMYAFDAIGGDQSMDICANALSSSSGAAYTGLNPATFPRKDVQANFPLSYTVMGERIILDAEYQAKPDDFEFAVRFNTLAEKLLAEGKLKVHKPSLQSGGLKGVLNGIGLLRDGKVSGENLVYRVADTPSA